MTYEDESKQIFMVVVNSEEQYSIWPIEREPPLGWRSAGKNGLKQECLDYIEQIWTDMRPLSLRQQMQADMQQRKRYGKLAASVGIIAPALATI